MTDQSTTLLRRTADSSVLVGAVRRLAPDSLLCAPVFAAARWWQARRAHARIVAGPAGAWTPDQERRRTEALAAFVADSRVLTALTSLIAAFAAAAPTAASTRLLAPILQPDLGARIRVIGSVSIVAVLTQAAWLLASEVSGHTVGWAVRIGVLLSGLIALARPDALAAAVRDRNSQ